MKPRQTSPDCSDVDFDVLLYGEETSAEFLESQRHVEYCAACQDRLAQTAADDGQWAEAQSMLSSEAGESANVARAAAA